MTHTDLSSNPGSFSKAWTWVAEYLRNQARSIGFGLSRAIRRLLFPDWYSLGREDAVALLCARPGCPFIAEHSEIVCPIDGWLMRASSGGWRLLRNEMTMRGVDPQRSPTTFERIRSFYNRINSDPNRQFRSTPVDAVLPWFLTLGTVFLFLIAVAQVPGTQLLHVILLLAVSLTAAELCWRYNALSQTMRPACLMLAAIVIVLWPHRLLLTLVVILLIFVSALSHLMRCQYLKVSRGRIYGSVEPPKYGYESVLIHWGCSIALVSAITLSVMSLLGRDFGRAWAFPVASVVWVVLRIVGSELSHSMVGVYQIATPRVPPQATESRVDRESDDARHPGELVSATLKTGRRLASLGKEFAQDALFTMRVIVLPIALIVLGQVGILLGGDSIAKYVAFGGVGRNLVAAIAFTTLGFFMMTVAVGVASSHVSACVANAILLIRKKGWIVGACIVMIAGGTSLRHGGVNQSGGFGVLSSALVALLVGRLLLHVAIGRESDRVYEESRDDSA